MKSLLLIAAVAALTLAKPEMYKETEDFQYSRSSSDEGSKAGYYGAQRGNMGGNYEKAHNMDGLAQHQMSGLVRQVDGELGDGFKTRTGSVYTAASSRGIYGSGNYDLSNLKGRNFEETESFGNSQHSSSMSHNAAFRGHSLSNSAAYGNGNSHAHSSGYSRNEAAGYSEQVMQTDDLQSANNLHSELEYDYGNQAAQHSRSNFQSQHAYDQRSANLEHSSVYDLNTRSLSTSPVRVVVRPGARITIPLTARTYDDAGLATSSFDHRKINNEAELLSTRGQQTNFRSSNTPKHYESSYSYRKQWKKHDTQPVSIPPIIPTVNPYPTHSQIYDENEIAHLTNDQRHADSYNSRVNNGAYIANTKSAASSQSRYQAGYDAQKSSSSLASNTNLYKMDTHASHADANSGSIAADSNLVELLNTKPKSYHSSYSYHKAWERQGDPYIIKPVGSDLQDSQISQQITSAISSHEDSKSRHYGSQYRKAYQSFSQDKGDCDQEGHIRVARSYNTNQEQQFEGYQGQEEEVGQHTQSHLENLEDLGQQTQNQWEDLQDLGQQVQNQWSNLQDIGQQTQEKFVNLEDLGQQTQNKWDKVEDLGQQTQNEWDKLEDLGQQSHTSWDNESQQSQSNWNNLDDLSQQIQSNLEQQIQPHGLEESKTNTKLEALNNFNHQSQITWNGLHKYDVKFTNKSDQNEDNVTNNLFQKKQNELGSNIWTNIQQSPDDTEHVHDIIFDLQPAPMDSTTNENNKYNANQLDWQNQLTQSIESTNNQEPKFWEQSTRNTNKSNQSLFATSSRHENNNTQKSQQLPFKDKIESGPRINEWNTNGNSGISNSWKINSYKTRYNHSQIEPQDNRQTEENVSPLGSLWDKLNRIAKETLTNATNDDNTLKSDSQDSKHWTEEQNVGNMGFSHKPQDRKQQLPTESRPVHPQESLIKDNTEDHNNGIHSIDIGRGDIGPEDFEIVRDTSNTLQISKPYKNPQQIEALSMIQILNKSSQSTTTEKQNVDKLSVLSIVQQKFIEELKHKMVTNQGNELMSTTTISVLQNNKIHQSTNNDEPEIKFMYQNPMSNFHSITNSELAHENIGFDPAEEQHNIEQQFEDSDQHIQDLQSQSKLENFEQLQTAWQPQDNLEPVQYEQTQTLKGQKGDEAQISNYNQKESASEKLHRQTEEIQTTQNISQILKLPEPVTEKSGFWKSVGTKLTNAKDKVYSWFGSGK